MGIWQTLFFTQRRKDAEGSIVWIIPIPKKLNLFFRMDMIPSLLSSAPLRLCVSALKKARIFFELFLVLSLRLCVEKMIYHLGN